MAMWNNERVYKDYPGKRPQTVWWSGMIMYYNVDDDDDDTDTDTDDDADADGDDDGEDEDDEWGW